MHESQLNDVSKMSPSISNHPVMDLQCLPTPVRRRYLHWSCGLLEMFLYQAGCKQYITPKWLMRHVALVAFTWPTILVPYICVYSMGLIHWNISGNYLIKASHEDYFKDRTLVDETYWQPLWKWVAFAEFLVFVWYFKLLHQRSPRSIYFTYSVNSIAVDVLSTQRARASSVMVLI